MEIPVTAPKFPQCHATINIEERHETAQLYPFADLVEKKTRTLEGSCEKILQQLRDLQRKNEGALLNRSHSETITELNGTIKIQQTPEKTELYSIRDLCENILPRTQTALFRALEYMDQNILSRTIYPLASRCNDDCGEDYVIRRPDIKNG